MPSSCCMQARAAASLSKMPNTAEPLPVMLAPKAPELPITRLISRTCWSFMVSSKRLESPPATRRKSPAESRPTIFSVAWARERGNWSIKA